MQKITPAQYVRQVRQELARIFWPTKKETLMSTGLVLAMVAVAAAFLSAADWVFVLLVQLIYGSF